MTEQHILVVDCSAFAYRAFYTMPAMRRQADGEPTGAVLGFMSMIWRMLGAAQADLPTLGAAVFDAPGPNFRHDLFPAYKGGRDPARTLELKKQLPIMRPVAEVLGFTNFELEGFEADDLIATLVTRARAAGIRSTIVSSDKDFGQLVEDGWIEIVDPMQRMRDPTKSSRRLEVDIARKFGVPPRLVPDVQALAGDAVDGIPGVKGVGLEMAGKLVRRFGSLDAALADISAIRFPRVRAELKRVVRHRGLEGRTNAEWARLFFQLTTLRRDVPLEIDFPSMALRPIMKNQLEQVARALDPAANIQALFGLDLQDVRVVDRVDDPLEWWREEVLRPGQRLPAAPQCGFYKTRLVHGGPWVPARIWRDPQLHSVTGKDSGYDLLKCEVGGKPRDPMAQFTRLSMHPIRESDFLFEVADAVHAKAYRPDSPKANPTEKIDLTKQPAPRNPRLKLKGKSHV